jgi:hypothetical protein
MEKKLYLNCKTLHELSSETGISYRIAGKRRWRGVDHHDTK